MKFLKYMFLAALMSLSVKNAYGDLTLYHDRANFEATGFIFATEDFEGAKIQNANVGNISNGVLNSSTDNNSYDEGEIVAGIAFDSDAGFYGIGEDLFGVPTTQYFDFGPFMDINFNPGTKAVGFDSANRDSNLAEVAGAGANVEVFDMEGMLIDSFSAVNGFSGFTSTEDISRVRISLSSDDDVALMSLDNVSFATAVAVPEPSSLMMLGAVMTAGALGYRRRR